MPFLGTILATILATTWATSLAAPASAPTPACPALANRLGPSDAPIAVDVYADPVWPSLLTSWLELRRLVAEQGGQMVARLHPIRPPGREDPELDSVRGFVVAAAMHGRLLEALRAVAREGTRRIHARLADRGSRDTLAREIGVDPPAIDQLLRGTCPHAELVERTAQLLERRQNLASGTPIFVIGDLVFDDNPELSQLRPAVARFRYDQALTARQIDPPAPPEIKGVSRRLLRPNIESGVLVGGRGLPHRFLLFAKEEDDPNLFGTLADALDFRGRHPGRMSIQVLARGDSTLTETLRLRLCAAAIAGRELDYLRFLARDPGERKFAGRYDAALIAELDALAEKRCVDRLPPQLPGAGVPDGPWIDGIVRSRADLWDLPRILAELEAGVRPLTPLLAPAAWPDS